MTWDFGDFHYRGQAVIVAARTRNPRLVRQALWVIRQSYVRGLHVRFTFRDFLILRRHGRRL